MRIFICLILILTSVAHAQETGIAAKEAEQETVSSNWQNWTFAGTLIATATLGLIATSFPNGEKVHHSH